MVLFAKGLVGAAFLVYLGITTLVAKPTLNGTTLGKVSLAKAFLSTLGLTPFAAWQHAAVLR